MASVNGFTKDVAGNLLPSAICSLFKDNLDGTCSFIQQVTSDAVTAAYHFDAAVDSLPQYFVVAWKDDTPHVFDCTDHVLQPIADSGSLSAVGTAAVQTVGVGAGTGATGDVSMVGTGDMQFIGQGNGLAFLDGTGDMQLVGGPIGGGAFSAIGTGDEQMAVQATVPGDVSMTGTGDEQMAAANQNAPMSITGTGALQAVSPAGNVVAPTLLTSGVATTVAVSQNTASVTLAANALQIMYVTYYSPGVHIGISVTNWTEIAHANLEADAGIYAFRHLSGSGSTGAQTINVTGAAASLDWSIEQWTGTVLTGTNGSGAIGQSNTVVDQGTNPAVSLSAPAASSGVSAGFGAYDNVTSTPDSPYIETSDVQETSNQLSQTAIYGLPGDTSPSVTFTGTPTTSGIAMEILAA